VHSCRVIHFNLSIKQVGLDYVSTARLPEVNWCELSVIMVEYSRQKLLEECVRLLAKQSVCHVQLVLLLCLVECRQDVTERTVKLVVWHVVQMQHLPHLFAGLRSGSEVRHCHGNADAER